MKDKIINLLLPLSGLILLALCILIFATTSKAASPYFPMGQNDNNIFTDDLISDFETHLPTSGTWNYLIAYNYYNPNSGYGRYYYYYLYFSTDSDGSVYGEIQNNEYQFSLYTIGNVTFTQGSFYTDRRTPNHVEGMSGNMQWPSWFSDLDSSIYNSSKSYVSNFRIYTDNTSSNSVVLNYNATPSYDDEDNDTYPNNFDKPGIGDYINTDDIPPFDATDGIGSLWNIMKYCYGHIIPGLGNYIIDSINWGLQKVINNIRLVLENVSTELQEVVNDFSDMVNGFLSDIKDFVSDIKTNIEYFVEPLQSSEVNTAFTSTNFYGIKTQFTSTFTTFENAFDISEPNTFTLTVNIQNIDTFYNFGCRSPVIIHLDEHFTPIKTALRTFLWILISFGTVFVIEKGLANWLRGERKE